MKKTTWPDTGIIYSMSKAKGLPLPFLIFQFGLHTAGTSGLVSWLLRNTSCICKQKEKARGESLQCSSEAMVVGKVLQALLQVDWQLPSFSQCISPPWSFCSGDDRRQTSTSFPYRASVGLFSLPVKMPYFIFFSFFFCLSHMPQSIVLGLLRTLSLSQHWHQACQEYLPF